MTKKKEYPATKLNDHDRKILDKYTKHYTNFIESSTAKLEILKDEKFRGDS